MIASAAIAILLLSAVCHAGWNALLARTVRPHAAALIVLAGSGVLAGLCSLWWRSDVPWSSEALLWSIAAGGCETIYFYCLPRALERYPLGSTYTVIRGVAMLLVWSIAALWLGERLSWHALLGTCCVLGGVACASTRSLREWRWHWMPWAYGGGLGVTGYHLCYARAMHAGASPAAAFAVAMAAAALCYAATYGPGLARDLRAEWRGPREQWIVGAAAIMCAASFLLFLLGLQTTGAGIAIVVRSSSVVIAQVLAWWMGEPRRVAQIIAVALTVLGVALLQ